MLYRGLEKNGMVGAWHGRCMASVNQTRPHCVNQMGNIHSKPLAARHGRGTAWARHVMCESALTGLCRRERLAGCYIAGLPHVDRGVHRNSVGSTNFREGTNIILDEAVVCVMWRSIVL